MRNALELIVYSIVVVALAACNATTQPASQEASTIVAGIAATPTAELPAIADPVPSATRIARPPALATAVITETTQSSTLGSTPTVDTMLDLSSYAAHPGEVIALRAQGFAPGETVKLQFSGSPAVDAGEVQADERGNIVLESLRIPALPEGEHEVIATGTTSGRQISRKISSIGFHPWVVLSNYALDPGDVSGFSGWGFVPGEEVRVYLDGTQTPLGTYNADDQGNVQRQQLLTATPKQVGKHNLEFVGALSGITLPVAFEVLPYVPIMELTSYAGPAGTTVGFTGHGFAASETVHAYLERNGERQEVATFHADGDGAFEGDGQFVVVADPGQQAVTITLIGDDSLVPVSQRFGVLDSSPWAGLSQYSGPVGTQITIIGKGFAAGETVEISVGSGAGKQVVASATADPSGNCQAGPLAVPADARGEQTFTLHGQRSNGEATTEFTVTGE